MHHRPNSNEGRTYIWGIIKASSLVNIGIQDIFLGGGLSHLCLKNIFVLPSSSYPIIICKKNRFQALHLAGRNEFHPFSFNKYNFFFHFWLLASATKWWLCPIQHPGWLVRLCLLMIICLMKAQLAALLGSTWYHYDSSPTVISSPYLMHW